MMNRSDDSACRMLENFHLLPVNMFEYASGFAAQLFRRLSDVPQSAIQQVCCTRRSLMLHWAERLYTVRLL